MSLEALRCKYCNGHIDPHTLMCEYCGTQYREENRLGEVHYIQTCPAPIQVLRSQVVMTDEAIRHTSPEHMSEYAIKVLSRNLADALAEHMKVETYYEPGTMTQIIRGTVRVVEPDFRF